MATKAESRKEESNGARNAAKKQKIPTLRRRSNRTGRSIRYRTQPAPISASHALLMNQHRIIMGGTLLCSWTARCAGNAARSEEHTSELQSLTNLVCRLLLEKKKQTTPNENSTT